MYNADIVIVGILQTLEISDCVVNFDESIYDVSLSHYNKVLSNINYYIRTEEERERVIELLKPLRLEHRRAIVQYLFKFVLPKDMANKFILELCKVSDTRSLYSERLELYYKKEKEKLRKQLEEKLDGLEEIVDEVKKEKYITRETLEEFKQFLDDLEKFELVSDRLGRLYNHEDIEGSDYCKDVIDTFCNTKLTADEFNKISTKKKEVICKKMSDDVYSLQLKVSRNTELYIPSDTLFSFLHGMSSHVGVFISDGLFWYTYRNNNQDSSTRLKVKMNKYTGVNFLYNNNIDQPITGSDIHFIYTDISLLQDTVAGYGVFYKHKDTNKTFGLRIPFTHNHTTEHELACMRGGLINVLDYLNKKDKLPNSITICMKCEVPVTVAKQYLENLEDGGLVDLIESLKVRGVVNLTFIYDKVKAHSNNVYHQDTTFNSKVDSLVKQIAYMSTQDYTPFTKLAKVKSM